MTAFWRESLHGAWHLVGWDFDRFIINGVLRPCIGDLEMESDDGGFEASTNNCACHIKISPGGESEGKVKSGEKWLPADMGMTQSRMMSRLRIKCFSLES